MDAYDGKTGAPKSWMQSRSESEASGCIASFSVVCAGEDGLEGFGPRDSCNAPMNTGYCIGSAKIRGGEVGERNCIEGCRGVEER